MRDISHKQITLRTARAQAVVFCSPATIGLIRDGRLPKGNLFDVARAAGFLGAKQTPQLLPHCHPVTIDGMEMEFSFLEPPAGNGSAGEARSVSAASAPAQGWSAESSGILISGEARSIGRTGIEMEVLTGVAVAALEIYDMLKPVDKQLEIGHIRLIEKRGGKSDRERYFATAPTCAVMVCSDSTAAGKREDKSGKLIEEMLTATGALVVAYVVVPDEKTVIQRQIREWVDEDIQFIFTTGGTGLGPRDNTVAAVSEILERDADGIAEAMRVYGQQRTPMAMMSRGVAGSIAHTLVVTLPGSSDGARESLEAILPAVFHARKMMKGGGH
ncbi:MAG TPA: bifunctional molybdenum cofactor biosynthesis protein MoaC/MoaB [Puia sp.]|nr:bifunctional molybdenum cofactor biosynthesis protein MoaC/MoaB [Puia sp.]